MLALTHLSSVRASVIQANNSFFIQNLCVYMVVALGKRESVCGCNVHRTCTWTLSSLWDCPNSAHKHLRHGNWKFWCRDHKDPIFFSSNVMYSLWYSLKCDQFYLSLHNFIRKFRLFFLRFRFHFVFIVGTISNQYLAHFYELCMQHIESKRRADSPKRFIIRFIQRYFRWEKRAPNLFSSC